jgi:PleD family two-component response regulator
VELASSGFLEAQDIPPIFYVSSDTSQKSRLAAVQAGGAAFFRKPVDLPALVERLDQLTMKQVAKPFRILLVDDDRILGRHHSAILKANGMEPLY